MNGIKANARIRVEQDVDFVLKIMILKTLGQPHDEVLMTTDSRYKNYKANEDRIIPRDIFLFKKIFGETGSVKYYQIFIPKHLVKEGKNIIFQKWRNCSGNRSCHVSIGSENHELTVASSALPCKSQ